MRCPFCKHGDTQVLDSRPVGGGDQVRRRRQCLNPNCEQKRFTTYERAKLKLPDVAKKGQSGPQAFDTEKLTWSIEMASRNRPVSSDVIEEMVQNVCDRARSYPSRSISSRTIGLWVIDELRERDQIACILYASVFEEITTIEQWRQLLEREANALPESARRKQMDLLTREETPDDLPPP